MNEITQIEYAIRYCITRDSYAFDDGVQLAEKHWDHLSESTQGDVLESVRQRSHDTSRCPLIAAELRP